MSLSDTHQPQHTQKQPLLANTGFKVKAAAGKGHTTTEGETLVWL